MLSLHSRTISVPRPKLLNSLKQNEAIHAEEYKTAMGDYLIALKAQLATAVEKANAINIFDNLEDVRKIKVDFDAPISHAEDYRKAIQMLEFSTSDVIEIDEAAFEAYVNNNWPWKQNFIGNAMKYATLSGRAQ